MNSDDSVRAPESEDTEPLVKQEGGKDVGEDKPGAGAVAVVSASAEEAPFSTQAFWLVVWMLK